MPDYRRDEWNHVDKKATLKITQRHMVDLWISCTETVQVFGLHGKATTLLKTGKEFRFRGQIKGYEALEVVSTVPFGLKLRDRPLQIGEVNSGERPPVLPIPEPSNMLLRMRQMQRAHHETTRMPVLEPDDFPSLRRYELDDDADVLFEEEALEKHKADRKKKAEEKKQKEEAKGRKEPEADDGTKETPPAPTEKPQEGHTASPTPEAPPKGIAAE